MVIPSTSNRAVYQPLIGSEEPMGSCNETEHDNSLNELEQKKLLERRLVLKYDLLLLPFLSFMYLFSSLDRSTLGNAVLDNFEEDVGITPDQFNTCITIFYAGFLLFQVPSNILLKRYTARRWLPLLMMFWGLIACLHATVHGYTHLLILRFLLGVFESGFFPGVLFFLTLFYKKDEMATRIALFWGSSVIAHSFAGVLAFGILRLRGAHGMTGWQWLFIVEGVPTVAVAIVAWFYLPASPETWSRLSPEERKMAVERLEDRKQHVTLGDLDTSNRIQAFRAFTDWKIWIWMVMFFSGSVANTSISNFLPLIIKGLGYEDKLSANLMSAPPYLSAVVVMIGVARSSDRFQERTFHAIIGASICIVGYALQLILTDKKGLYAAVFIAVTGIFVINPIVNAWLTSNIAPEMKRSVAAAMAVSANNSAGLLGANIYRRSDAPRYVRGHSISLGFLCVFIILALVQRTLLLRENRIREKICKEVQVEGGGISEPEDDEAQQEPLTRTRIGDEALDFRYRL